MSPPRDEEEGRRARPRVERHAKEEERRRAEGERPKRRSAGVRLTLRELDEERSRGARARGGALIGVRALRSDGARHRCRRRRSLILRRHSHPAALAGLP
jgi:hypothetical protein